MRVTQTLANRLAPSISDVALRSKSTPDSHQKAMVAVGTTEQVPDLTKLREVARQFEALFVGMLLRSMRNTVIEADILDPQGEAKYYRQLYDDELARLTAERGEGLGVADLIVNQYAARLAAEAAYGTEMASSLADGKLRSPGSSSGRER